MNTTDKIKDARLLLGVIQDGSSSAIRQSAARQLVDIAVELAAQFYAPDEVKPTSTEPDYTDQGEYRLLEEGEQIMTGDEYWHPNSNTWRTHSKPNSAYSSSTHYIHRRPVKHEPDHTEGGKYRMLEKGELICEGDEAFFNNRWVRSHAIGEEMSLAIYRRPVQPDETETAEPQVKMPEPPAGMKWEYRGMGWESGKKQGLTYAYAFADSDEANCFYTGSSDYEETCATTTAHYWEAVPIAANPDRPVIDLAMKYRTRDGREVVGLRATGGDKWVFSGYVSESFVSWTEAGTWSVTGEPHALDLIPTGETV